MGKDGLEREAENWVAKVRQRYPRVSTFLGIYVAVQFGFQAWTYVIRPAIDAASEVQFVVENWRAIGPAIVVGAKLLFSPIVGFVTLSFGIAYLVLDRRVARLSPISTAQPHTEQSVASAPDATTHVSSVGNSTDITDYQLEASSPDFRAVWQDLPNETFHLVNPEKEHFSHVAWVVGFTNRRQYHCIVRARLVFTARWGGKGSYICRTVVNGTWLEGGKAEIELADKETLYLILGVTTVTKPAEWLSVEDHRLTAHGRLGIEFRSLPSAPITIEVTTLVYGGETKTFTFSASLRTLHTLTDLTPNT